MKKFKDMKLFLITLLLYSPLSAQTLKVNSPQLNYTLKQDKERFRFQGSGRQYSYEVLKCSATLFEKFWDQVKYKKNDIFSRTERPDAILVEFDIKKDREKMKIGKNTKFGRYLANLPDRVQELKLAERRRCTK